MASFQSIFILVIPFFKLMIALIGEVVGVVGLGNRSKLPIPLVAGLPFHQSYSLEHLHFLFIDYPHFLKVLKFSYFLLIYLGDVMLSILCFDFTLIANFGVVSIVNALHTNTLSLQDIVFSY